MRESYPYFRNAEVARTSFHTVSIDLLLLLQMFQQQLVNFSLTGSVIAGHLMTFMLMHVSLGSVCRCNDKRQTPVSLFANGLIVLILNNQS